MIARSTRVVAALMSSLGHHVIAWHALFGSVNYNLVILLKNVE